MKLTMVPGPVHSLEKKAEDLLSAAQLEEARMEKVRAAAASPDGLLMDQSYDSASTVLDKLPKHIAVLKPVMEKMRETYPATFEFMRYQWSRLPPSMRMKMITKSTDYKTLYDDPEMKPFTEWLRKLEGSGGVENELHYEFRRVAMAERMRAAEMWQETDAALAEMRAEEATIEAMLPEVEMNEEALEELFEEGEPGTPEEIAELMEEIKEIGKMADDPVVHLMLHHMAYPRDAIDPTGNLRRIFSDEEPTTLSDADILAMSEQRAKLNRIMLGFRHNVLADLPEVEQKSIQELYEESAAEPTEPEAKAAWLKRMAAAAQQLEAAHTHGLTTNDAYRDAIDNFMSRNNTDVVPNPVALRLLIDSMQTVVDDYNPELKELIHEHGAEVAEQILLDSTLQAAVDEAESEDWVRLESIRTRQVDDDEEDIEDISPVGALLDVEADLAELEDDDIEDLLTPEYAEVVLKEMAESEMPLEMTVTDEERSELLETYEAHLEAYIYNKPLDPKYLTAEDNEVDVALSGTSDQAFSYLKNVLRLPDNNVRDVTRSVLLDYARKVYADLGVTVEGADVTDTSILDQIKRMRHNIAAALSSPGVSAEEKEAAANLTDLLAEVEAPILDSGYLAVDDPEKQWEEGKQTLQIAKDLLVEYNTQISQWEATVDSVFAKAREATQRMLDPANTSPQPWVQQLRELHEQAYGAELPNPLASVTSSDIMDEWARAVKEELMFEEARTKLQRERAAMHNSLERQMAPLRSVNQPAVAPEVDNGYYQFSETDIQAQRPIEERIYVSSETELDQLFSEANVGRYINFTDRDVKKYLPEGFSVPITRREFANTDSKALLLRQQTLEAIANLKAQQAAGFVVPAHKLTPANDAATPKPMMLHGYNGVGKSAVMSEVVYWARRAGWFVLYIPDANAYLSAGVYVSKNNQEGTWDQPKLFVRMFSNLISAHSDKLKEINLSTPTKVGKITAKTLFDVVEYGSVLEQYAAQCFTVFKNEIKKITQFPVLLAVDSYNSLYSPSVSFRDPESTAYQKPFLHPYNMTLGRMFYDAHVNHKLVYGTFIGALSESAPLRVFVNHTPDAELHGGCALVEPKYLEIVPYSMPEFTSVMEHYKHKNWIRTQMSTGSASELYIYQLTSGFPGAVWSYAKRL